MNTNPWPTLESIPALTASSKTWRAQLGEHFNCLRPFLRRHPASLIHHPTSTLLRLDTAELGRALSRALGLVQKTAEFPLPATGQIGSWSAEAVPAILTIQSDPREFRLVVAEVVARLRQPFILLAPTNMHFNAVCQELLANAGAGFLALEGQVSFTEPGVLRARTAPGELFARFTPQPKEELDADVAHSAFGLLQKLDAGGKREAPSVLTVFRLYCVEELTVAHVARSCACSKSTVLRRLRFIHARTGTAPDSLRRLSAHLEKLGSDPTESMAKRVYRKRRIDEEGEEA